MSTFVIVTFLFYMAKLCDSQPVTPSSRACTPDNEGCRLKANLNFQAIVAGNKSMDIAPSDPLIAETVYGDFPSIKFIYYNPKMHGFKNCVVSDFNINFEKRGLSFTLFCPRLIMYGFYRTKGGVFDTIQIDGEGEASVVLYDYLIKIFAPISIIEGSDNKAFVHMDKFFGLYIPKGPILLHFDSLYTRRKDLSDTAHRILDENSKELMLTYGYPLMDGFMEKFMNNANKFLAKISAEELLFEQN